MLSFQHRTPCNPRLLASWPPALIKHRKIHRTESEMGGRKETTSCHPHGLVFPSGLSVFFFHRLSWLLACNSHVLARTLLLFLLLLLLGLLLAFWFIDLNFVFKALCVLSVSSGFFYTRYCGRAQVYIVFVQEALPHFMEHNIYKLVF